MLPRDLDAEIVEELAAARRSLANDELRVLALESLLEIVRRLEHGLRHRVTAADVLTHANDQIDRMQRQQMLRSLRRQHFGPPH